MERHLCAIADTMIDRLVRLNRYTGDGDEQKINYCLAHPAFQLQQESIMEIFEIMIPIYLIVYTIWAAVTVYWYKREMKRIDRNHEREMKRIADEYETNMNRIREDYKNSVLKYNVTRTLSE